MPPNARTLIVTLKGMVSRSDGKNELLLRAAKVDFLSGQPGDVLAVRIDDIDLAVVICDNSIRDAIAGDQFTIDLGVPGGLDMAATKTWR